MMYYQEFSELSSEELSRKISKLHDMRKHYLIFKQMHMVESIDNMLQTCYYITDERSSSLFDNELLKTSGVMIDTGEKIEEVSTKENKNDNQPRAKRRRIVIA